MTKTNLQNDIKEEENLASPAESESDENQDKNKNDGELDKALGFSGDESFSDSSNGGDEARSNEAPGEDGVVISKSKLALAVRLLDNIKENNEKVIRLLSGLVSREDEIRIGIGQQSNGDFSFGDAKRPEVRDDGRIIEGVFDGENMIGPDGKQYSIPANYASKSKLVEGDILKLTITPNGTFVYKQIGPIERSRLIGVLEQDSSGNFMVVVNGRKLRILTASVTYFKGRVGDEVVVLVPKAGDSKWAAVENIVKKV